jgi:uncharacterized protein YbaP (TraB family)
MNRSTTIARMRFLRETGILPRMERRRLRPIALVLVLAGCAALQPAPPAPKETGQLVFWEVESRSQQGARAWLLGSVHAGTPDLTFDPAVETAFAGAGALVIEADITAIGKDGSGFIQRVLQQATLPEGKTLDQILAKPTWDALAAFLNERGQSAEGYRRFEPWLVMTMVTSYLYAEAGLPPSGGVDLRFTSRAEGRLPIVPLETIEFQLSLLDSLDLDTQGAMLAEVLGHQDQTRDEALRLYEAWQLGDLAAIERMTTAGMEDPRARDFREKIFLERNRNMAARIDALLAEPRTWFVIVGAGHMVGENGIPALLAARGHRVTRIAKTPGAAPAEP